MTTSPKPRQKTVLVSVTDKSHLNEFERLEQAGWRIVSTSGTAKALRDLGISCDLVEDITGFPEMMSGRLKMLHPKIFGGVLADLNDSEHLKSLEEHGIPIIDMVCVNFYPFENEPALKNIDIGGPSLVMAAVKTGRIVIINPSNYQSTFKEILESTTGEVSSDTRNGLASMAATYVANFYDEVDNWVNEVATDQGKSLYPEPTTST